MILQVLILLVQHLCPKARKTSTQRELGTLFRQHTIGTSPFRVNRRDLKGVCVPLSLRQSWHRLSRLCFFKKTGVLVDCSKQLTSCINRAAANSMHQCIYVIRICICLCFYLCMYKCIVVESGRRRDQ